MAPVDLRALKATALAGPVRTGLTLALITAIVSGVSIFVNGYAAKEFESPAVFTTLKNTLVGLALLAFVLHRQQVSQARALQGRARVALAAIAVVGGSVPFVLFFEGLSRVESGNAAFIHKTLFLWVAVLALVFLRERIGPLQAGALGLLLVAYLLLGGPGALGAGTGEAMVLAATLLWAVEAVLARRLLQEIGSSLGAAARMAGGATVLLVYLTATGKGGAWAELSPEQIAWLALTAALLLAYVTTWYAALKRAPAAAVTSALAVGAPITALLNVLDGKAMPDGEGLLAYGLILLAASVILMTTAATSQSSLSTSRERAGATA